MHVSLLGNTSLTIKGNNLGSSYHVPYVTVGGMPCIKVIPVSSEEVVCKTPPGAAGNHPVGVSVSGRTTEACLCSDSCNDRVKRCVTYHRACGRGEIYRDPPHLTLQPSDTLPPLSSYHLPIPCTYCSGPEVHSIKPRHGSIVGGTELFVKGVYFGQVSSKLHLNVGDFECREATWVSSTSMRCVTSIGRAQLATSNKRTRTCPIPDDISIGFDPSACTQGSEASSGSRSHRLPGASTGCQSATPRSRLWPRPTLA